MSALEREVDCSDPSDGLEFEDASSGAEEDVQSTPVASPLLRLPRGVPTGAEVVQQALETRAAFQTRGISKLSQSRQNAACGDQMRKSMPPFFAFSRLLAEEQKHAIWSLWGVCNALDFSQSIEVLQERQQKLNCVFDSGVEADAIDGDVWVALRAVLKRYSVIRRPFQDMADGIAARRPGGTVFNRVDDLMLHTYRFGGSIGLMALPVLSEDGMLDGNVAMGALALGMALQLTDLLNCVGHHYRTLGNRTIPKDLLQKHAIDESELERNLRGETSSLTSDPRWQALMQELLSPVRPLLQHASWAGEQLPAKGRIAVRVAVRMCMRVVGHIEKRKYDSITRRTKMFTVSTIGDVAGAIGGSKAGAGQPSKTLVSI